ncbi:ribonuclease R [SAR92 clade bacterium H455]|uniref:Ribonuclease R n=1 Tax=SAR92 clade bacterium H455 TaxID=2974818 RepID=A0ABY5TPB7_9GAMM|nr:ribonuclease R [SAR92 clade bacterium H455]
MSRKEKPTDPYASREASKYQRPVPSREFVLDYLRESVGPLTHEEICVGLQLVDDEQVEAMRRRLRAMERDGQIARNRADGYGTLDKLNLVKGRVIGHPEGYGFVSPLEAGEQDIYLSSRQMRRVFDGDIVLVRIAGRDRRGRPEGTLVDVVERKTTELVGRYFCESGIHFVRPDNPRISQDILIAADQLNGAAPGQIVLVGITDAPSRNSPPSGHVAEVLGDHLDPGLEIEVSIRNYGIPHQWNDAVQAETDAIPDHVTDKEFRVDLRALPLVTIDGEDARDFDDAVYCQPKPRGGWKLIVAIADVSHYVKPGSALDIQAFERGNSVYFPNHVVPMLPEKLSNGLCSLNPHEDRLCMVCEMQISREGDVTKYQFYEAVMYSHARMTYTQVAQIIEERGSAEDANIRDRFATILPQIDSLHDLYRVLHKRRSERGAIDFDTQETRILFDSQRKISQIIPVKRTEAHRLIEECMLAANVCTAQFLEKSKLPALYRVHEGPSEDRLSSVRDFLGELGMGLGGGDDPQPEDYQRVLRSAKNRDDASVIQSVLLRSMSQAVYQAENLGHFGLAFEGYTHFTSPIRRYADLLVHRAIRSLIRSNKKVSGVVRVEGAKAIAKTDIYPYELPRLDETGAHLSVTERRADEATRDVVNWLKCEYLVDRVGQEYSGVVTAVTGFGLFVMLDELYVEGLVHVTGLPKDYYNHEAAQHRMVGERTGRVFRLGDKLRVKVVRVNLDERKIDFELAGEENSANHSGARRPAGKFAGKAAGKVREQDSKSGPKGKKKRGAGARSGGKDSAPGSKRRRNAPKPAGQTPGQGKKGAAAASKKKPKR